jgi:hypothetical protein
MSQSNAIGILENILNQALITGNKNEWTGMVLLKTMQLEVKPRNLIKFFELLANAKEEVLKLKVDGNLQYISSIEKLELIFTENFLWGGGLVWSSCITLINSQNFITILQLLAEKVDLQNPKNALEADFLDNLRSSLESLLAEVDESDLSKKLKKYINQWIRDIVRAIDNYNITGSEPLRKNVNSFVLDLTLIENNISNEEKKKPFFIVVRNIAANMAISLLSFNVWDIIGVAPDIEQYWMPGIQQLIEQYDLTSDEITLPELINKVVHDVKENPSIILPGKEQKFLPPAKQDSEIENDTCESNSE